MELCRVEGCGHDTKELKNYILKNLLPLTLLNFSTVLDCPFCSSGIMETKVQTGIHSVSILSPLEEVPGL